MPKRRIKSTQGRAGGGAVVIGETGFDLAGSPIGEEAGVGAFAFWLGVGGAGDEIATDGMSPFAFLGWGAPSAQPKGVTP